MTLKPASWNLQVLKIVKILQLRCSSVSVYFFVVDQDRTPCPILYFPAVVLKTLPLNHIDLYIPHDCIQVFDSTFSEGKFGGGYSICHMYASAVHLCIECLTTVVCQTCAFATCSEDFRETTHPGPTQRTIMLSGAVADQITLENLTFRFIF